MNKLSKRGLKPALASILVAAGIGAALAQAPAPQPRGPEGRPMHGMQERAMKPTDRAEARLSYIRTALKITPAQEPQWNAYAGFVRKTSAEMEQRFNQRAQQGPAAPGAQPGPGRQRGERPNAVERIERQQAMHAQAQQRLGALLAVQKPLYEVLTPDQRKVADEVLAPRRMAMRGGGFRRG